jgi:deoxycytidine triphosphate deaminase
MHLDFSYTEEQAEERYQKSFNKDPFPDIKPALLNSSDIQRYICETGMIHPFDENLLKPSSYALKLKGRCIYWDDKGKIFDKFIDNGMQFELCKNSIAFVTLEPLIKLPYYIAARFNLKIKHIYKGLLLGTGPLVDPGFNGFLSLPLHNLTNNNYTLRGGEELIWMEFTKLSPHNIWDKSVKEYKKFPYKPFNKGKKRDVMDYIREAEPNRIIRSSIPEAIFTSLEAGKKITKLEETFKNYSIVALIVIVLSIAAIIIAGYNLVSSTLKLTNDVRLENQSLNKEIQINKNQIEDMRNRLRIDTMKVNEKK